MSRHPSLHTLLDQPFRALTKLAPLARGHVLAGRYVIGAQLGRGAVGRVFRAYDRATKARVALKVVHPEVIGRRSALARFGREVRHARDVQHPNVCRVFELVESGGFTFFTMELATRGSLRTTVARGALRPIADRMADARAVTAGLAAIHQARIVHRDLKPENLLRMSDGRLVVSDFGLARSFSLGRTGSAGTLGYMAPEVRKGNPAGPRSDVWSLGVVLHEILFGGREVEAAGQTAGVEAALAALCQLCTETVPARRPANAGAVLARLEELDGETLDERIRRGRLPLEDALGIAVPLLESLAVIHRRGRAHGAVAPANLFLPRAGGSPRLLDPETDAPLGTAQIGAAYLARAGEGRGTEARRDILAVGRVLVECLSPRPARRRATTKTPARRPRESLDALLARVPASVRPILHDMLAPDRVHRAADTGALALKLAALRETIGAAGGARRPPPGVLSAEQRVTSVVLIGLGDRQAPGARLPERAIRVAEAFGAAIARIAGDSFAATLPGKGTPTDLACAAARCALALKTALPDARFAVSTGRLSLDPRSAGGDAAKSALALLRSGAPGAIGLDGTSARLLSSRFRIGERLVLLGESALPDRPRTVLGKELPCVGRDRELGTLMGLWDECSAESVARAALVTAPAGTGKSRVRHELLERIQSAGAPLQLLVGRGDALRDGTPFAMLGPALRTAVGLAGGEAAESQRAALLALVRRHVAPAETSRVAAFLGEIADTPFSDDGLPTLRAARQDPRLMTAQTLAAWLDLLEAESRAHPVLLVLEDLHWGDEPSVQFVDAALRTLGDRPLMVLAFARPEVDEKFGNLWNGRDLQRISLPPLTPRSVQKLIHHAVGDLPDDQTARIVARAGGNPFFLEELLRAVSAGGDAEALPETIIGTVQARFDALGADAKRVLRAAAIFGETFPADGVRQVLGGDLGGSLDQWLEILVQREVLFAGPAVDTRELIFRHALLQEAAYDMLTADDRVRGHRMAGKFLEANGEREAILLVEHYQRGGEPRKAAHWCRFAAEQALDATDLGEALRRVERGLRLGAEGETLAALQLTEAQSRFWRGEYVSAEGAARRATEACSGGMRFLAAAELIAALGQQTRFDEVDHVLQGVALPESASPLDERAWLGLRLRGAAYLLAAGRYERTEELLRQIEGRQSALDDGQKLRMVSLGGQIAVHRGDQSTAVAAYQSALRMALAVGDQRFATEMLLNLGVVQGDLGLLEEAEKNLTSALAATERMGLPSLGACVLFNLSLVQAHLGHTAHATGAAERSFALARQQGDWRIAGAAEIRLAMLSMQSSAAVAETHARSAVATLRSVPPLLPAALAALARVLLARGRADEALASAREAFRLVEKAGTAEDGEASAYLAYAQCLLAAGEKPRAQEVLSAAARRLKARAAMIDPRWRAAFLERIPDHAQTIALSEQR